MVVLNFIDVLCIQLISICVISVNLKGLIVILWQKIVIREQWYLLSILTNKNLSESTQVTSRFDKNDYSIKLGTKNKINIFVKIIWF